MKKITLLSLVLSFYLLASAQNNPLTWSPYFCTDTDTITIIYDATKGNGALAQTPPPIYAHTGVITNLSSGPSDWKYVKSQWGVADTNVLMTSLGNNLYRIKYHIRSYYNVPANETILSLAFVFRNTTGSVVGRNADGSDMFIPVYTAGLNVKITDPALSFNQPLIVAQGSNLNVTGICNANADLSFLVNGVLQANQSASDTLATNITFNQSGNNQVVFEANDGITTSYDTIIIVVNPQQVIAPLPTNTLDGITYLNDSAVILNLYAPSKNFVYVLGSFNSWTTDSLYFMHRTPAGDRYWVQLNNLLPGEEYTYQYFVDGELRIGDPYCHKIVDPNNDAGISLATYPNPTPYPTGKTQGIVSVLQTAQTPYTWTVTNFTKPAKTDLIIYELCIRDFVGPRNFQTLLDTLEYLQVLGINAIELMPVNEFEGNNSWGYNPSYYFAVDKYYGTKDKLKEFIDTCHARGIAVISDIVLNHSCGQSPMVQLYWDAGNSQPAANSPWFNQQPKHDFNVCYDMNHDAPATEYFVDRVVEFWINEFKVDGYRFDLAKGFTQKNTLGNITAWNAYDGARIDNLKRIADVMWNIDPTSYVILEMFADNQEEKELADYGMMLWGNMTHNYNEATMGWLSNSNFSGVSYQNRGYNSPHLVGYMESHDEQRLMFKNITFGNSTNPNYNLKDTINALARMELASAFFYTVPGPKMLWQFGELGYDVSLLFGGGNTAPKPLKWFYYYQPARKHLYDVTGNLMKLKKDFQVFKTNSFNMSLNGGGKSIRLNDSQMNAVVLGNFDIYPLSIVPYFQHTGWWYEYFTGDSVTVSHVQDAIGLTEGEYRLYTDSKLPAFTPVFVEESFILPNPAYLTCFPNPASSEVTLMYFNSTGGNNSEIMIYDLNGRLINTLPTDNKSNVGFATWNLKDNSGQEVVNGLYIARVAARGKTNFCKIEVHK
ncbi:MAG: T9SS type A sorting domain-containing protein [Bacteroidetes bacterium]|nr:T9SS type A sorting domain-containing protein [Bacteroidota bacterium]